MPHFPRELNHEEIRLNIDIPSSQESQKDDRKWAVIGQERAVQALEMGVSIRARGYNIFVAGESGTGKHTAVRDILSRHSKANGELRDIAYVQDFSNPDKPKNLSFPQGKARTFKEDLKLLIDRIGNRISGALDAEAYKAQRDSRIAEAETMENKVLTDFEAQLTTAGFRTVRTDDEEEGEAADIAPLINGEIIPFDDLQDLVSSGEVPESTWTETRERYFAFMDDMKRIYRDLRTKREQLDEQLTKLKSDTIRPGVAEECAVVSSQWTDEAILTWLKTLEDDVLENADWFAGDEDEAEVELTVRYGLNIVVDRDGLEELPVIHETNPTKTNLFGAIEARYDVSGELRTDMTMIKAGSLLQADGGFLILQAEDVFSKDGIWLQLKRALLTGHVVPEVQSTPLGPLPILMKPEPVKVKTTVILVGPARFYETLCAQDEEFLKLFKVAAEFSPVMNRNKETEEQYALFARGLARKENLLPITDDGIHAIIGHGVLLAEKRDRLSTRFSLIGDLIREAHYGACTNGRDSINREAVKKAIAARQFQGNLPESMLIQQIAEGTLIIDVKGERVGSINGLAVLERGYYAFGTPLRITVAVGPGKEGLINIERESGLSGELHDKGVFLLEGYLRHRFARRQQLALTASIAVEQSYYEIDGDSASAAELAAFLSAIAELPLRQDIAVTGAVNQQGLILPVGGIHEKVHGFFQACEAKGFTGTQGVIVPTRNSGAVILPDDVIEAVAAGKFHIWTARTIDEVMTLLTGLPAGTERRNGKFERRSVNEAVRLGLEELAHLS